MIYDLQGSIGYQLTVLSKLNERQIELALEEFDLTRLTWVALVAVGANSLSQPSRIAEFLGMDRPMVSRALTSLQKLGLIERVPSGTDARQVIVQITKEGLDRLSQAAPKIRACNEKLVADLSEDNRTQLYQLLTQLNASRPSLSKF